MNREKVRKVGKQVKKNELIVKKNEFYELNYLLQ